MEAREWCLRLLPCSVACSELLSEEGVSFLDNPIKTGNLKFT